MALYFALDVNYRILDFEFFRQYISNTSFNIIEVLKSLLNFFHLSYWFYSDVRVRKQIQVLLVSYEFRVYTDYDS